MRTTSFVRRFMIILLLVDAFVATISALAPNSQGWSNGGYSSNPTIPDYGTHDWIAEHALDWLPTQEKQYMLDNLAAYRYGTELPDNGAAPDGISDTTKHHIYYNSVGTLTDDAAALRASTEYNDTLTYLQAHDYLNASKNAGIMTHYISDMAVFGHVMGSSTPWGAEVHHSDYETYVNDRTSAYIADFKAFLSFDGNLDTISAYEASRRLAYDTTFDTNGDLTCVWMDQNYDWTNPAFRNRAGESLNLAVNYVTDVLHTLYLEAAPPTTTPSYNGLWHAADFTITLTAIDIVSGVKETYYKINGGPTRTTTAGGQPLITKESGSNMLEFWSIDNAGNEEPHQTLTNIKLDKTQPTGSIIINNNDTYAAATSVTLSTTASDTTSGVYQVRYSNDGVWDNEPWETPLTTKTWTMPSADGENTVYYQIKDNAGLTSTAYSDSIILDTTAPTIIVTFPKQNIEIRSSTITATWIGFDEASDISNYEIRLDSALWVNMQENTVHKFTDLPDGIHTLGIKAIDNVGNTKQVAIEFTVNTSPILGPGYMEEGAIVATIVAAALTITTYLVRRKRKS